MQTPCIKAIWTENVAMKSKKKIEFLYPVQMSKKNSGHTWADDKW